MISNADQYRQKIDAILEHLDNGRQTDTELQRINEVLSRIARADRLDGMLGDDRYKLFVARALVDYYHGNKHQAAMSMQKAIEIKGHSFAFAEEFLARLHSASQPGISIGSTVNHPHAITGDDRPEWQKNKHTLATMSGATPTSDTQLVTAATHSSPEPFSAASAKSNPMELNAVAGADYNWMRAISKTKEGFKPFLIGLFLIGLGFVLIVISQVASSKYTTVNAGCQLQGLFGGGQDAKCAVATGGLTILYNGAIWFGVISFISSAAMLLYGITAVMEVRNYDRAIVQNPNNPDGYIKRSAFLLRRQLLDAAVADCDAAIALDPGSAAAYNNRGVARQRTGDYHKALADYKMAYSLEPHVTLYKNNVEKAAARIRLLAGRPS